MAKRIPDESIVMSGQTQRFSLDSLRADGWLGFVSIHDLQSQDCQNISNESGVYLILNSTLQKPNFLLQGTGGFFKSKDPNISLSRLHSRWVDNSIIVYVGKAGGGTSKKRTLRKRLNEYMRFGAGEPVAHWGGRLIWQIEHAQNLLVCWKPLNEVEPCQLETQLIRDHERLYGKPPFANLMS